MIYHRCTDCRGSYFLPSIIVDARVPIVDDRVMIVVAAAVAAARVADVSPARFYPLNQIS